MNKKVDLMLWQTSQVLKSFLLSGAAWLILIRCSVLEFLACWCCRSLFWRSYPRVSCLTSHLLSSLVSPVFSRPCPCVPLFVGLPMILFPGFTHMFMCNSKFFSFWFCLPGSDWSSLNNCEFTVWLIIVAQSLSACGASNVCETNWDRCQVDVTAWHITLAFKFRLYEWLEPSCNELPSATFCRLSSQVINIGNTKLYIWGLSCGGSQNSLHLVNDEVSLCGSSHTVWGCSL